ncbi:Radical SAM superfamily enzyme, MoaA/NifB/PqqE/SkfB family [Desulfonatronum thiosulfatophilum]|uniref:Radical SAM superfamily enzyme, MoaA/NifB/PqqE/SkfB family n=1 Tax=Desulfonatronum thiosulfatophilum TaxID=617002 RepID=A0A1G6BNZ4_9BACT|nr:radical SAM protein [Desulfonatronum thiosulfatophilum]SDB22287.1 Radical SAM superfamily enzyme, MoaA/NifB/PqqE/SkfB family [Desulfonatronum thiosulfatophilum]
MKESDMDTAGQDSLVRKVRQWWEHKVLLDPKDWMQIEVTSKCNADCAYCPRTVYRDQWHDRFMSLETFRRLVPALRKTKLAYLQGWGEPFLHPEFPTMVRLAKEAGCTVGVTTNGMLLTEKRLIQVMDAGLDILAFSLTGTTPEHNDPARAGAPLVKVLERMDMVRRIKQGRGTSRPAVHIAYMLLRSGLDDLEGLPRLMADHGVEQAVISVLDFEPGVELSEEVLAPKDDRERQALEERFTRLREAAAHLGVIIHTPSFAPKGEDEPVCAENVQRALFVSADGEVSPCVYANVPVDHAEYARQGQPAPYSRVTFGNVNDEHLPVIWRNKQYDQFREGLEKNKPATICRNCPKRKR